jgi:prepilin-type N-terminal cleavage/methylation domain-containing protein
MHTTPEARIKVAATERTWTLGERGFTLPEVLIVIVLMGILFAIASSSWFGVVESRRVDSATNQMVSDLRSAHTSATNRLSNWRVEIDTGTPNYRIGPSGGALSPRSLPEGTKLSTGVSVIVFEPDGKAQVTGSGNLTVAADDGDPSHVIQINTITSRIKVVS